MLHPPTHLPHRETRLSVTEVIEGIQVLIVVAYRETEVFLLLFSDRLLNFTRRGRSR